MFNHPPSATLVAHSLSRAAVHLKSAVAFTDADSRLELYAITAFGSAKSADNFRSFDLGLGRRTKVQNSPLFLVGI